MNAEGWCVKVMGWCGMVCKGDGWLCESDGIVYNLMERCVNWM